MSDNVSQQAPDFSSVDLYNQEVNLADFKGKKNVVLVFNRGFT